MTKPVLYPFPYAQAFPSFTAEPTADQATFMNDPAKDGVQLNVNIVGDPLVWADTAYYSPGLEPPASSPLGATYLDGVAYASYEPGTDEINFWSGMPWWFVDQLGDTYIAQDEVSIGTVATGVHEYPGVASVAGWSTSNAYIQANDVGLPMLVEFYFSDNPDKAGVTGYNGYTHFGDQGNIAIAVGQTGQPGEYVRKYVMGILKQAADSTDPDVTDIMYGVMFTGTVAGGTGVVCVNGAVVQSGSLVTGACTDIDASFDTSYSGVAADLGGFASGANSLGLFAYTADALESVEIDLAFPGDAGYGINTHEVKFVQYVDRVSGYGDGTPVPGSSFYFTTPVMYTHPGWTAAVFWQNFIGTNER